MEQPPGLARFEIPFVHEGPVPLRGGAFRGEVRLRSVGRGEQHPRTPFVHRGQRRSRRGVAVFVGGIEGQGGFAAPGGRDGPDLLGPVDPPTGDRHPAPAAEGSPHQADGYLEQHFGIALERGGELHQHVADRRLGMRVAAVPGLGPDQGGVVVAPPVHRPRPGGGRVAADRDLIVERKVRHFAHHRAAPVPDLDPVREPRVRNEPGKRRVNGGHEQVAAVRRGREALDDPRPGDLGGVSGQVRDDRAGRSVVAEERVVVRAGQQVLVGPHRGHPAGRFLDHGRLRNRRSFRRPAAARVHDLDGEMGAVSEPAERGAPEDRVHSGGDAGRGAAAGVHGPQLHAVVPGVGEGEPRPVGRPAQVVAAERVGQAGDRHCGAAVEALQRDLAEHPAPARRVGRRVDPEAGDPQFGPRQFGERDQAGTVGQHRVRLVGRDRDARRRRRLRDPDDRVGRRLVALLRGGGSGQRDGRNDQQTMKRKPHDGPSSPVGGTPHLTRGRSESDLPSGSPFAAPER